MTPPPNRVRARQRSSLWVRSLLLVMSVWLAWLPGDVPAQPPEGHPLRVAPGAKLRATVDGKSTEALVATADCRAASTVVQYHEETIRVTASGVPSPVVRATFSDPSMRLVRINESSTSSVSLTLYAGARVKREPVDVTLHGAQGARVTVPAVLCVETIDAAVWLIEGLQPTLRSGRFDEFDFDLSLQVLTTDPKGRNGLRPLAGTRVAFGAAPRSNIAVRSVAQTLTALDAGGRPWTATDGHGRVYVRVRADVRAGIPLIEARFGGRRPSGPGVSTEALDRLRLVTWTDHDDLAGRWLAQRPGGAEPGNDEAFAGVVPDPASVAASTRSLVERVLELGIVQVVGVEANRIVERISDDVNMLQRLIYVALVNSGVERDPAYFLVRSAVALAQGATGPSGDTAEQLVRRFGLTGETLERMTRARAAARQALQSAGPVNGDEIARIIYGALLLGELHGVAKAGFDQTVGTVVDLAVWLKSYVDECRRSPAQTAVSFLRFQLRWNPIFGPAVQSFETAHKNYKIYSEAGTRAPQIEPAAFQHFLDKALPYLYVAGQLPARAPFLVFSGTLAALESLPSTGPILNGMLRHAAGDVGTFASALGVRPSDPKFSFFAAGYLTGLGTAYVVGVIGIEVIWFVATDGVATYVKGMVALQKAMTYAKTASNVLNTVQNATLLIDGARLLAELRAFVDELGKVRRTMLDPDDHSLPVAVAWHGQGRPFELVMVAGAAARTGQFGRGLLGVFQVAVHFVDDPEKLVNVLAPLFGANKKKAAELLLDLTDQELTDAATSNRLLNALRALEKIKTPEARRWVDGMRVVIFAAADEAVRLGRTPEEMRTVGRELIDRLSAYRADSVERLIVASADIANNRAASRFFGDLFAEVITDAGRGGSRPLTAAELRQAADRAAGFLDALAQYDAAPGRGWLRGRLNGVSLFKSNMKEYLNDLLGVMAMPSKTLDAIRTRQLPELTRQARFSQIPPKQALGQRRAQFDQKRSDLIAEWEKKTGVPWPRYDKTLFKIVDEKGDSVKLPVVLTSDAKPDVAEQIVAFTAGHDVTAELKGHVPKHIIDDIRKHRLKSKYVRVHKVGEDHGVLFPGTSKAAEPLDAHHVIEIEMGGQNAWWNLIPLKNPHWHQGLVHGKVSKLREIMDSVSEYDILQLFD